MEIIVWKPLKNLKVELPYEPVILLLGIYLDTTVTPVSSSALFTIAKTWEPAECPSVEGWIKKTWCVYTLEDYSAIKMNKIVPFAAT